MESGTLLHLALLKKIAQLSSTQRREGTSNSVRRHQFISNTAENNNYSSKKIPLPLMETNLNL